MEHRRTQIVASPARLKSELEALVAAVEAEKEAASAADARKRDMLRRVEIAGKADKDVGKAMTLMAEAEVRWVLVWRVQQWPCVLACRCPWLAGCSAVSATLHHRRGQDRSWKPLRA
jgi:hypothetical protein